MNDSDASFSNAEEDSNSIFDQNRINHKKSLPAQPRSLIKVKTVFVIIISFSLIFHLFDIATDIIYVSTTDFDSLSLFYASICFIGLSPLIQALLTVSGMISIYRLSQSPEYAEYNFSYFGLKAAGAVLLSGLGLFDVLFLVAVCSVKSVEILEIFELLSKSFAFVSALTESIPQIIITMLNNYYTNTWSSIGIASLAGSMLAALYDALTCIAIFNRVIHIEPDKDETTVQSPNVILKPSRMDELVLSPGQRDSTAFIN